MKRVVKKEEFSKLLSVLLDDFELIGPKQLTGKGVLYQPITELKDLYLGEEFAVEPIKKFFLEPSTWITEHEYEEGFSVKTLRQEDKKRIVIGVRPCEARGLVLLDNIFDSDYKDSFYITNRNRTTIIGLACNKPNASCFCTSLGSSPSEILGIDALLFDIDDSFVVEIITEKGKSLLGSLGEELRALDEKKLDALRVEQKNLVKKQIKVPDTLDSTFESDYWQGVSLSCVSCGICTYLCPTCHCFDLVDEERKKLRCYDACSFGDFTLEASGENPRPTKKERYRQRVFHKFDYFRKNFGVNLCTGCGRCIRYCPVKIDIADIVDKAPVSNKDKA